MGLTQIAADLAPGIAERGNEIEAARRLPNDIAKTLAGQGLFTMLSPRSVGGAEVSPLEFLDVLETLARADAATGWCTMIASTTALTSAYLPAKVAKEIYARPDTIMGGVFAPTGKAVVEGKNYRVNGAWQWTSGGANCDWLMGGCVVIENGEMRKLPNGAPDARMVIFPASEVELIDTWYAVGMSGTGSGDMAVKDLLVPQERSVSIISDKPVATGPLYRFPVFGLLAMGIAAVALGNARGALDELKDLALEKRRRDSRRTVAETGHGQTVLAQAEAQWRSARLYLRDTAAQAWELAQGGDDLTIPLRAELRLAATHATRTSAEVARAMYDLGGGTSVYFTSPLQRRFRDAHVATQHMMAGHATYELAGRALYGLDPDPTFL